MATWEHDLGRRRVDGSIGEHNFDAQSHRQLYEKIHGGPGYPAAQTADDAWAEFLDVMRSARSELEAAIRQSGAVWQGAAGERFTSSNAPLVQWADDARTAAIVTRASLESQALSYLDAKGRMPEPVEVTSTANDDFWGIPAGFAHLVGGQTDQDLQEARAQEAKRLAVAVMNGYRERASAAVDSLGEFVPPPSVATRVVEPATVERSEAQQPRITTPRRLASVNVEPGYVEPEGSTAAESHDLDRTGTSAGTSPREAPSRPTPGTVTTPSSAPAPPATTPVGISFTNRPSPSVANPFPGVSGSNSGKAAKGGALRGFGGGTTGRVAAGRGGGDAKPLPPGGTPATPTAGPGGLTGVGNNPHANRSAAAPARGAGATAGPSATGLAAAPQTTESEDDREHQTAPYLEELDDVWGEDSVPRVAPPVIGEDDW
ncbi:PPE domain-containing protein [Actinosynnema sp. NPDC053489]|uniref:PPE domain-containing protein n=1 Tax=Actinosynnema sp. NPDC053489 TaxID=3363916 RepID=UPI0037C91AF2